jgi:glutaconyl-CoA decarboxylase
MNYRVRDGSGESRVRLARLRDGEGGWKEFEWSVGEGPPSAGRARREGDEVIFETAGTRHRLFVAPLQDGGGPPATEVVHGPEAFRFQVLRGAGAPSAGGGPAGAGPQDVHTPMPGRVQAVHVEAGARVRRGDLLVTLEAMKMQNEFLAPVDGRVAEVRVKAGAVAGAGDVLLVIEPGPAAPRGGGGTP